MLTFQKGQLFKNIIDSSKDLVDTTILKINSNGLQMSAMDSSNVSLCQLYLYKDGFQTFTVDEERELGLSLKSLSTVLKCSQKDDILTISTSQDSIDFILKGSDKNIKINMKLLDIDNEELEVPEMEYKTEFTMSSREFYKLCSDLSSLGDTCTIKTEESILFTVSGDIGNATINYIPNIKRIYPMNLTFSMRYLQLFSKAYNLSDTVTISMEPEAPMKIEYNMGNIGILRYYLAPRIDE